MLVASQYPLSGGRGCYSHGWNEQRGRCDIYTYDDCVSYIYSVSQ